MSSSSPSLTIRIGVDSSGAISNLSQVTQRIEQLGNRGNTSASGLNNLNINIQHTSENAGGMTAALHSILAELTSMNVTLSVAAGGLARLNSQMNRHQTAANGLDGAYQSLMDNAKRLGLVFAGMEVLKVNAEFQSLRVSLATVVGGTENARLAFQAISDYAARTPFEVQDVTKAYIQMRTEGLTPTLEMMTSLGNTASARGVELKQLVAAVGDATRGQFERLARCLWCLS
jgi:phage tail tape-measure protein